MWIKTPRQHTSCAVHCERPPVERSKVRGEADVFLSILRVKSISVFLARRQIDDLTASVFWILLLESNNSVFNNAFPLFVSSTRSSKSVCFHIATLLQTKLFTDESNCIV